jgi:hypothetical protein
VEAAVGFELKLYRELILNSLLLGKLVRVSLGKVIGVAEGVRAAGPLVDAMISPIPSEEA